MPITLDFTGKLMLVTGGGRGIGLAISKALAEAGADVAISYTSKDATPVAKELSDKYGKKIRAFKCEVTKSNEVDALVEQVRKEYNREIDICVANAGISLWKDAHENTDRTFNHLRRQHLWLLLPLPSPHSILARSAPIGEFSQ